MKTFFKNPLTIWIKWLVQKIILERRHGGQHLRIGYLSEAIECAFGVYNTIYDNVFLYKVALGDFSYISSNSIIMSTKIGKFSAVGNNVICGLAVHPTNFVSVHPAFYSTKKQSQISFVDHDFIEEFIPVHIGNDVWIGSNVSIKAGITIGDGAIIGAGSVVTKNVPPYAIMGGVPAKIIRYRFSEEQIHFLEDFRWWDKDPEWLRKNGANFHEIDTFIRTSSTQ